MLVYNPGGTVTKGIIRPGGQPDDHGGRLGYYEQHETDPSTGSSFGLQVYAPGSTCIQVMSVVRDSAGQVIAYTGTAGPQNPWLTIC